MPELPEVETVRRGLAPALAGRRIVRAELRRAGLRFPFPDRLAERLAGARVEEVGRRAKYLAAPLDTGEALIMHLGMTGRFSVEGANLARFHHEVAAAPRHEHVVLHLDDGARIGFHDPRRFGFFDLWPTARLDAYPAFAALGPEPLSDGFDGAWLRRALAGRSTPVKAALLDQSVAAGLGNIYACEALHRAQLSPRRSARSIGPRRAHRLAAAVREVIAEAIAAGGSSISDFAAADGASGYFQHSFRVYDREGEPCPRCGAPVRRLVQAGRSTFFCGGCQR